MSNDSRPSGHNKQYYKEEEDLLVHLKSQQLSWPQIVTQFNEAVSSDRQRNIAGLTSKWCQLKSLEKTNGSSPNACYVDHRYDCVLYDNEGENSRG